MHCPKCGSCFLEEIDDDEYECLIRDCRCTFLFKKRNYYIKYIVPYINPYKKESK